MNYYSNIGVIGTGFVGGSVRKWFKGCAHYSLEGGSFDKVDKKEFIFLCLPTPFDEKVGFKLDALSENIKKLSDGKNIIIKSTVLPQTTKTFQSMFPQHNFFFNPEFLTADRAWKDFKKPSRQIVGYAKDSIKTKRIAREILDMLPPSENCQRICDSSEAEMVKLVSNCHLALRVVYANQMYDYCEQENVEYNNVIDMVTNGDKRIEPSHWDIWHKDYRGYSGFCFPKDMGAVIYDSNSELLRTAHELNDKYIKDTKK